MGQISARMRAKCDFPHKLSSQSCLGLWFGLSMHITCLRMTIWTRGGLVGAVLSSGATVALSDAQESSRRKGGQLGGPTWPSQVKSSGDDNLHVPPLTETN